MILDQEEAETDPDRDMDEMLIWNAASWQIRILIYFKRNFYLTVL